MGNMDRQIALSSLLNPTKRRSVRLPDEPRWDRGLWVTESCDWMELDDVDQRAEIIEIGAVEYRRLDPELYAQLERDVRHAKAKAVMGRMCAVEYTLLEIRFEQIRKRAEAIFGASLLRAAIDDYNRHPHAITLNRGPDAR